MIRNTTNNIYSQFLQLGNTQAPKTHQPAPSPNTAIASVSLEQNEKESNHLLTKTVASLAIAGSLIGLFFAKGFSQKFFKRISFYMQKLDDKIFDYTQRYNSLSTIQKWALNVNKGLKKCLASLSICNNITAIRDSSFLWVCKKLHIKKPMDWVTKQFQKITIKSSNKAYQNARNIADNNLAKLRDFIPQVKDTNTKKQLTSLLNKLEGEIQTITNATSRKNRLKEIQKATSNIGEKVRQEIYEIFKNPQKENLKKLSIYRTEIHAATGKNNLLNTLQEAKRTFSFNIEDKTKILSNTKDEIAYILGAEDKASRATLREISKQISQYAKISGAKEQSTRAKLIEKIQQNVDLLKQNISKGNYSPENSKILDFKINEMKSVLENTEQKGTIEDILQLLNSSLKTQSPQEYAKAKVLTTEIRRATNKAFESELKLYDKFAEYNVGSAPTDVLGLLLPVGVAGYAISKGQNKDEKVSATLKAGIPIVGGVATTFVATAKMMTNIQGLFLGAITGFLLNALGSKVDEHYKEYQKNQTFVQKAIVAYKKENKNQPA